MKKCKYCKSEINEEAIVCPICKRNQNQRRNINIVIIIIGVIFIIVILSFIGKEVDKTKDEIDRINGNSVEQLEDWLEG